MKAKLVNENIQDFLKPKPIELIKNTIIPPNSNGDVILLKNTLTDNYNNIAFVFIGQNNIGEWEYWIYGINMLGHTALIRESYLAYILNDIKNGNIIDDDRSFYIFSFIGWQKVYNEIKNDYPEIYDELIK